jgi:hypothetical protein|eukprot:SAG25_NODE_1431_length_3038_cov_1.853692_4_plen_41_part_00
MAYSEHSSSQVTYEPRDMLVGVGTLTCLQSALIQASIWRT